MKLRLSMLCGLGILGVLGCEPSLSTSSDTVSISGATSGGSTTRAALTGVMNSTNGQTSTSESLSSGTTTSNGESLSTSASETVTSASSSDSESSGEQSSTEGSEVCQGWVEIEGDLHITDSTDLASLICVSSVTGSLFVNDTSLETFQELANLKSVGGTVQIGGNASLVDLAGLEGLIEIKGGGGYGEATIFDNPMIENLDGLKSLEVMDYLTILNCDGLSDLSGVSGKISGSLTGGWGLSLVGNKALSTLDSLAGASNLTFRVYLADNPSLTDISALETVIDKDASVEIYVQNNDKLLELVGFHLLTTLSSLVVDGNDSLVDLSGLESVAVVTGAAVVTNNESLEDLSGLGGLEVADSVEVGQNPSLISLEGLDSLQEVQHSLSVGDCETGGNPILTSLVGLEAIETIGNLGIQGNNQLVSLNGLDGLTSLDKVWVQFNPLLPSLEAVELAISLNADSVICKNKDDEGECECANVLP